MEGPEITAAEATIDNGSFGTRTIRFETGRLAKQAGGAVSAYLDGETMLLSTTTAGKTPKDHFDFFPLTVDVEERMYAAGRIPGSFFRREGRPSTDAILTCRLIDRPLRPTFRKGLRNEVQVVITVLALNPDHQYDVLAINGASASTVRRTNRSPKAKVCRPAGVGGSHDTVSKADVAAETRAVPHRLCPECRKCTDFPRQCGAPEMRSLNKVSQSYFIHIARSAIARRRTGALSSAGRGQKSARPRSQAPTLSAPVEN